MRAPAGRTTVKNREFMRSAETEPAKRSTVKCASAGSCEGCQTWSHEGFASCFVTLRPEEIDWAGLRAAAVAIGIRQAARQAARDLPSGEQERFVQRAMKRCSREKWLVQSQQDKAEAVLTSPTALSAKVPMSSARFWQRIVEQLGSGCQPLPEKPPTHSRKCLAQRLSSTPRRIGTSQQVQAYCTAGTTKAIQYRSR